MIPKKYHQPHHLYLDDTDYFLTACIYGRYCLLKPPSRKMYLYERIRSVFADFDYKFYGWTILDEHYHILFKTRLGKKLGVVMRNIHGNVSHYFNELDNKRGRRVWQSYWDHCIRDKNDFYKHLNYIHQNCIKHGLAKHMEDYPFSSFHYWAARKGRKWIYDCFESFPIVDFTCREDDDE